MSSSFFLFCFVLLEESRVPQCSRCTEVDFFGWPINMPSLIRSSQLMAFQKAGTQAAPCGELCFLCLQYGPSCYYTTASASPATTNIPTTTAVSTTVKSSVLVGNKQSWINTESKRWNIYLNNIVLQISLMGFVYMVLLIYWIGNLPSVNCTPTPPLPQFVRCHHICIISPMAVFFFLKCVIITGSIPERSL